MKSAVRYLVFLQKQNGGVHLAWKRVVGEGSHPGLQGAWNIKINISNGKRKICVKRYSIIETNRREFDKES